MLGVAPAADCIRCSTFPGSAFLTLLNKSLLILIHDPFRTQDIDKITGYPVPSNLENLCKDVNAFSNDAMNYPPLNRLHGCSGGFTDYRRKQTAGHLTVRLASRSHVHYFCQFLT